MSKVGKIIAIAGLLATGVNASPTLAKDTNKPAYVFGPPPSWDEFRKLGEAEITGRLVDPESARIRWTGGFHQGEIKPFMSRRMQGYYACGLVNSKNRMGGYGGAHSFMVLIDYGHVTYAEIDRSEGGEVASFCAVAARNGFFPPMADNSSSSPASSHDAAGTTTGSGLTLRAMPEGAYITAIAPGSIAANAGLKPGMVIASVNGIPLAGMGEAMLKVVQVAGAGALLKLIEGTTITLPSRP